jgi:hypothetical protein
MKYIVKMDSGAMIHVTSFIKIALANQKLIEGGRGVHTAWRSHMPT